MIGSLIAAVLIPPPPIEPTTAPVPATSWSCSVSRPDSSKYRLAGRFGPIDASPQHPVVGGSPQFEITEDESGRLAGKHAPAEYVNGNYIKYVERPDRIYALGFHFERSAGSGSVHIDWWLKGHAELMTREYGACTVTRDAGAERGQ